MLLPNISDEDAWYILAFGLIKRAASNKFNVPIPVDCAVYIGWSNEILTWDWAAKLYISSGCIFWITPTNEDKSVKSAYSNLILSNILFRRAVWFSATEFRFKVPYTSYPFSSRNSAK